MLTAGLVLVGHFVIWASPAFGSGMVPAGHFCKGTLKGEESAKAPVSLVSWKDDFQVSSSGTLAGIFAAPVLRQFWKERHKSIINNDVRSAVVGGCREDQIEALHLVPAVVAVVPDQESWKRQKRCSLGKAASFSSKGWEGKGWILTPRSTLLASLRTALCICTLDFAEGPQNMCLDSGRVSVAVRNVAGQCVNGVSSVVNLARTLAKGGAIKARWAATLWQAMCRPQIVPPRGSPGAGAFSNCPGWKNACRGLLQV